MQTVFSFFKTKEIGFLHLMNQRMQCSFLDILMNIITHLGSLPVVVLILVILLDSDRQRFALAGRELAMVLILSQCIVHPLKWIFNRPRPFRVLEGVVATHPPTSQRSFPSGHTCAAFATAITLGSLFPSWLSVLLFLALLVGLSRIYLGAHYPSDVLVGILLAIASWALL